MLRTRSVDAHGVRSGIAFSTYNVYILHVWAYALYIQCTCTCIFYYFYAHLFYQVILSWFVDKPSALKGALIEEENVECRPEKVSNAVLDENVDICLVRKYFSHEACMDACGGCLKAKKGRSDLDMFYLSA